MNSTAFVICSRRDSSRVPSKAFIKYNGKPHIQHLVERLLPVDIPIYIAIPSGQESDYHFLTELYPKRVFITAGFADDPLRRMYGTAKEHKIENVIRVTHDKIFVDPLDVFKAIGVFKEGAFDYLYSSKFVSGTGFEIISFKALEEASKQFSGVEHISYAVRAITKNQIDWTPHPDFEWKLKPRLLVDYPEDVELMQVIFATLGSDCAQEQVIQFISENPWLLEINRAPAATIYTCAHNAEKWIEEAMGSVAMQTGFGNFEYILIDDYSNDRTAFLMSKFCQLYRNSLWSRNSINVGLASSSNIALKKARGEFIIRLDADDYFTAKDSVQSLLDVIRERNLDAVYPNNWLGVSRKYVQIGADNHHVGGSIFRTSAINHVKFTEGLRNYEGLEFFKRAQKQIKVGYLNKPTFVYRQHDGSMSKNNLEERAEIRNRIESQSEAKV